MSTILTLTHTHTHALSLQMIRISGKLKYSPDKEEVIGLVAECHLIEFSSSVLEVIIRQSIFTCIVNSNTTVLSVDPRYVGSPPCTYSIYSHTRSFHLIYMFVYHSFMSLHDSHVVDS